MAAVQLLVHDAAGRGLPGASAELRRLPGRETRNVFTDGEGIARVRGLQPGRYVLGVTLSGFSPYRSAEFELKAGDVAALAIKLEALAESPGTQPPWRGVGPPPATPPPSEAGPYRELPRASGPEETPVPAAPAGSVFIPRSDRWNIPVPESEMRRKLERRPRRWNPFARNKWKGDEPIIGQQTFFNFTAISDTLLEARRLPVPSLASSARPGSAGFFGRGGQFFYPQYFRFSFDLFHGDTAYRPVDWRIRITPVANINYTHTQENGVVNIDVRKGTDRFDWRFCVQEAFAEVKLRDLSPHYDFISVRAGIQQFTSDFRGFLFAEEQPGVRLFGNLHSNRWEYNAAYFNLLEKDTNSFLNTLDLRHQQVLVANLYVQDFVWLGYTAQLSYHFNKDDADIHFDTNDFLVRPAPIGAVRPGDIRAHYIGWTGNGHIGRVNLSHAFYQALGHESLNQIAGRGVDINAQFAALELSVDKDWARFKASALFASGDGDPRDGAGRGFDAIVDEPNFAGGIFSLWQRESIRLTGTGVQLVSQDSFLPSLRSNKFQGQANFVNPGILLVNVGTDLELTPKLRALANANFMRFHHTQPLELLLFQRPIHSGIGADYSLGLQYRPLLSENIVLTGGASVLAPYQGFRDIYFDHALFSMFTNIRFKF